MIQYTIILHCITDVKSFAPDKYSIFTKSAFCTFLIPIQLENSIITIHMIFGKFFINAV